MADEKPGKAGSGSAGKKTTKKSSKAGSGSAGKTTTSAKKKPAAKTKVAKKKVAKKVVKKKVVKSSNTGSGSVGKKISKTPAPKLAVSIPVVSEKVEEIRQKAEKRFESKSGKTVSSSAGKAPDPSMKLYRKIAISFVVFVAIILCVVLFVSTVNVKIQIEPKLSEVHSEFLVNITGSDEVEGNIRGSIARGVYEKVKTFDSSGKEKTEVLEKSGGTVTIYNTSNRNQPLVATTRLLSSEGILFRLDKGVMVAAGGEVVASVSADEPGSSGDIGPDNFTIPGLATSLQSKIYGESVEDMTGGVRYVSVVEQEDLDIASNVVLSELLSQAETELRLENPGLSGEAFFTDVIEKTSDTLPGAEVDEYTISVSMNVLAVFFSEEELASIASAKLLEEVESGNTVVEKKGRLIELVRDDENALVVRVKKDGNSVISLTNEVLDKQQFVGLSESEIKQIIMDADIAADVSVRFFPPWVKSAPQLKDHIDIQID